MYHIINKQCLINLRPPISTRTPSPTLHILWQVTGASIATTSTFGSGATTRRALGYRVAGNYRPSATTILKRYYCTRYFLSDALENLFVSMCLILSNSAIFNSHLNDNNATHSFTSHCILHRYSHNHSRKHSRLMQ